MDIEAGYEMALLKKLRTVKDRVLYILDKYPETRNNDLYLWLIYVRLFEPELSKYIKFIPYDVLEKSISFETIRRLRQKIQNDLGLYPPTDPKVLRRRRRKAEAMRKVINKV